eukprot:scaffold69_cov248-Pinguiococcus_pyrenoidosus.AAC.1
MPMAPALRISPNPTHVCGASRAMLGVIRMSALWPATCDLQPATCRLPPMPKSPMAKNRES